MKRTQGNSNTEPESLDPALAAFFVASCLKNMLIIAATPSVITKLTYGSVLIQSTPHVLTPALLKTNCKSF